MIKMLVVILLFVAGCTTAEKREESQHRFEKTRETNLRNDILDTKEVKTENQSRISRQLTKEDIDKLSDAEVLEALKRIPGINIEGIANIENANKNSDDSL